MVDKLVLGSSQALRGLEMGNNRRGKGYCLYEYWVNFMFWGVERFVNGLGRRPIVFLYEALVDL